MKVSIHQPSYFPWLGLLDKIAKSELYILMDEVQLADRAYQHRNIFLAKDGQVKYLTLNINKKGYRDKTIRELELADETWQSKHRNFLVENYGKAPFFDEVYQEIELIFQKSYTHLIDVLADSMDLSLRTLGINTRVLRQSELVYDRLAKKSDLILALVKSVGGDHYLSGTGAREYMQLEDFAAEGIVVSFNCFHHPQYPQWQLAGKEFVTGLNCLDVIFNLGITGARNLFWDNLWNEGDCLG